MMTAIVQTLFAAALLAYAAVIISLGLATWRLRK